MRNFSIRIYQVVKALLLVVMALSYLSCTTVGTALFEKPQVSLDKVNVKDMNVSGATLLFGVKVTNPNPIALKVDSVRYELELAGKPFSKGSLDQGTQVQANGNTVVEIPVSVRYSDLFSSLSGLFAKQSSTYRIKGDASFGFLSVPFDHAGEFKLKK